MVGMFEAREKLKKNGIIEQIITNKKDNVDKMGELRGLSLSWHLQNLNNKGKGFWGKLPHKKKCYTAKYQTGIGPQTS